MPSGCNDTFSRTLTDKGLEFDGWNLFNPRQIPADVPGSNAPPGPLPHHAIQFLNP